MSRTQRQTRLSWTAVEQLMISWTLQDRDPLVLGRRQLGLGEGEGELFFNLL